MTVRPVLKETLENCKLTRNAIAVKAQVRPATLHDLVVGNSKSINFETLDKILNAMNELDDSRQYDISDIVVYEK